MTPSGPHEFCIEFLDNGTAHDDLKLTLGNYERTADTYYLLLDYEVEREESPAKVRRTLVRLLKAWNNALQNSSGSFVYLPYELSDQYTGCLRCKVRDGEVEVMPGFSSREGWSFSPSDPGDYFLDVPGFKPDMPEPIWLPLIEFLQQIKASIANAENQTSVE